MSPARASGAGRWIVKTEPSSYSWGDLEREGRTVWDGVKNAQALIHLRAMREGDQVLVYHSGDDKALVGLARVARGPYPDPKLGDPKLVVVELAAERALARRGDAQGDQGEQEISRAGPGQAGAIVGVASERGPVEGTDETGGGVIGSVASPPVNQPGSQQAFAH